MTMSLQEFVPTPRFEEYRETFKDFYQMQRRDDGVPLVAAHTQGGPVQLSVQNHRSLGQMLKTVGADPSNEVLILTGSGSEFMMSSDPSGFALEEADMEYWAYEYAYKDGRINVSALVNDVEIPTIGVLNGPGFHSEIVLMCDITLAAEDAVIFDLHYDIGSVPADASTTPSRNCSGSSARPTRCSPARRSRPSRPWSGAWSTRWCRATGWFLARRVRHPDVRSHRQEASRARGGAHPVDRRLRAGRSQE
jgi:Enoyl-CoA hydratase/isomerase